MEQQYKEFLQFQEFMKLQIQQGNIIQDESGSLRYKVPITQDKLGITQDNLHII